MIGAIVGFFATAGAAGVDFGLNSVDDNDVQKGGMVGIIAAIILTAGISVDRRCRRPGKRAHDHNAHRLSQA